MGIRFDKSHFTITKATETTHTQHHCVNQVPAESHHISSASSTLNIFSVIQNTLATYRTLNRFYVIQNTLATYRTLYTFSVIQDTLATYRTLNRFSVNQNALATYRTFNIALQIKMHCIVK